MAGAVLSAEPWWIVWPRRRWGKVAIMARAQRQFAIPDRDIIVLDPRFAKYKLGNTAIQRLHTGMLWAEGPAWNGLGRYLVWSDIPNNVQHRWLAEDGHTSVFRNPSNYSNGNTFDWDSRQLSCEPATRHVVPYAKA